MEQHKNIQSVRDTMDTLGARGEIRVLPDSARTAAEAASALGIEVGAIANSLIFDAGGTPILILTSGAHRVDTKKVEHERSLPVLRRASPDFVRRHTGQVIGGVAPIAHPEKIRTYVDQALRQFDVIWASAGHPNAVFSTSYDELVSLTDGTAIDVA